MALRVPSEESTLERFGKFEHELLRLRLKMAKMELKLDESRSDTAGASHDHDTSYSALAHDHDATYSAVTHNHDTAYAALAHNHDGTYSDSAHNHDGTYSAVTHNHDTAYAALAHNHDGTYSDSAHNHDGTYSAAGHNHDTAYATLVHTHAPEYFSSRYTWNTGTIAASTTLSKIWTSTLTQRSKVSRFDAGLTMATLPDEIFVNNSGGTVRVLCTMSASFSGSASSQVKMGFGFFDDVTPVWYDGAAFDRKLAGGADVGSSSVASVIDVVSGESIYTFISSSVASNITIELYCVTYRVFERGV
jgi:hypothetical protein